MILIIFILDEEELYLLIKNVFQKTHPFLRILIELEKMALEKKY